MKLALALAVVLCAAAAAAIGLNQNLQYSFSNCSSSGSAAQAVSGGNYVLTVTGSDLSLCQATSASTCASGGTTLPLGTVMIYTVPAAGLSVSCRSSSSTGNLQLTQAL